MGIVQRYLEDGDFVWMADWGAFGSVRVDSN